MTSWSDASHHDVITFRWLWRHLWVVTWLLRTSLWRKRICYLRIHLKQNNSWWNSEQWISEPAGISGLFSDINYSGGSGHKSVLHQHVCCSTKIHFWKFSNTNSPMIVLHWRVDIRKFWNVSHRCHYYACSTNFFSINNIIWTTIV